MIGRTGPFWYVPTMSADVLQSDTAQSPALRSYLGLERLLSSEAFVNGGRLPAERVLAEQLETSRGTVRQALLALEARGLVEAVPGSGWFATRRNTYIDAHELRSFTEIATSRGLRATATVLLSRRRAADFDEAERLRCAPSAEVYEIERIRQLDGLPVLIHKVLVPVALAPDLELDGLEDASLQQRLEECGCSVHRADYAMRAAAASPRQAELLHISSGDPVLAAEEIVYDRQDRVIQSGRLVFRGDSYRFEASLYRRDPAAATASAGRGPRKP